METKATFKAGFFGTGSPEITSRGRVTFDWLDGQFFLIQRFVNDDPAVPSGITIIGMSEHRDTFAQHYYDRGVARVYQMTLEGREWKLWREEPVSGSATPGRSGGRNHDHWCLGSLRQRAEWRHDFDLTYIKTG